MNETLQSPEDLDGFEIRVYWDYDHDTSTDDADCYDEADLERFASGDSYFVQYCVTAGVDGVVLGDAYIGGCDVGYFPDADGVLRYTDPADITTGAIEYYIYDLAIEAVEEARLKVEKIAQLARHHEGGSAYSR